MANFFEKKRNQVILGVIVGIIFVGAITLVLTGKINLRSIMGNTAQGSYTCPEGQGYTLNQSTKKCEKTVTYEATKSCSNGADPINNCSITTSYAGSKECPSNSQSGTGDTCYVTTVSRPVCETGYTMNASYTECVANYPTYTCPNGYKKTDHTNSATCTKNEYYCDDMYGDFGKYTVKLIDSKCYYYGNSCSIVGGQASGNYCVKSASQSTNCGSWKKRHTGSGWECYTSPTNILQATRYAKTKTVSVTPTSSKDKKTPKCNKGVLQKGNCVSTNYVGKVTTCKNGGTLSGDTCYVTNSGTIVYSCPNGGSLSGTNCVKTESIDATFIENKEETTPSTNNKEETTPSTENKEEATSSTENKEEATSSTENKEEAIPSTTNKEETIPSTSNKEETIPSTSNKEETIPSTTNKEETIPSTTNKEEPTPSTTNKEETIPSTTNKEETIPSTTNKVETIPSTTNKVETINAIIKYSCENGYTLNVSKCQKTDIKEPTSTFTCPTGYAKSGNSCYRIDNKTATLTYICESGYTYNQTSRKCEKESIVDVVSNGYTCPEGYDLIEGTQECIKITNVDNVNSCPYYYLDGSCIKIDYQNASIMNSCPTGYTLNNNICQGITSTDAIKNYKCSTGYTLNGKTCTKKITKTVNTSKYCPTGYKLINNKCQKTVTVAAKATYSCKEGYTLNGTTCTKTIQ